MPIADYAHWNEEAPRIWWEEEGRHDGRDDPPDPDDDRLPNLDAADAFAEGLAEETTEDLYGMLEDSEYCDRWPKAVPLIQAEIKMREES